MQVIRNWAFQWKMQFNPDPNKQAQVVYFSKRWNNENSLPVTFNNAKFVTWSTHKLLRLLQDKRLNFNEHIQSKTNKCWKMIGGLSVKDYLSIFPAMLYWEFINRLLDLIWIRETLFITNHITSLLKTKLKIFNIKLALQ